MAKFVRLSEANSDLTLVRRSTLYKWRTIKKYPDLFSKIGGVVLVDLEKLAELIEIGRGKPLRTDNNTYTQRGSSSRRLRK